MNDNFVQVKSNEHFEYLDICCRKIAEKVSTKPISQWINSDYIELSRLLSRSTKVLLSENTLKRIFGKLKTSERYYPQKATRDTLAIFLDYRDWREFELAHKSEVERIITPSKPTENQTTTIHISSQTKTKRNRFIFAVPFLALTMCITLFWVNKPDVANIKLTCINPIGKTPHSAVFKLSHKGALPDSSNQFSIDYQDGRKLPRFAFSDSLLSHYYGSPGRYYPKLYYKNNVIDTSFVYLQTDGWAAIASNEYDTTRVFPIKYDNIFENRRLYAPIKEVARAGIDTSKTFYIAFSNIKPSHISGDNFELKTKVTTSALRSGIRCSQFDLFIYGEKDRHALGLLMPQCAALCHYKFSEQNKNGSMADLRSLGLDLRTGGELTLKVINRSVYLSINGKQVFNTYYKKPIGRIMGIKFHFSGIGSVENINLVDMATKELF